MWMLEIGIFGSDTLYGMSWVFAFYKQQSTEWNKNHHGKLFKGKIYRIKFIEKQMIRYHKTMVQLLKSTLFEYILYVWCELGACFYNTESEKQTI